MKTFKPLLLFSFLLTILALQIKCAKTDDVEPVVLNNGTSNNDTIYINPSITDFVLNEILYDPPSGLAGDANNDGVRHFDEDEFVEFVNGSSSCIEISGCKIFDSDGYDNNSPNHQFPPNTFISSNKAVVVFGGGIPQGIFGNSQIYVSSNTTMNLNNSTDTLRFTDSIGNLIIMFDVATSSNNPDESFTRNPDLTGPFVQHNGVSGTLFSPGTKNDGTPF